MGRIPYVVLNGELMPGTEARIGVDDLGFVLGDGVFETLRADAGMAILLEAHLERLAASLNALQIETPWTGGQLATWVERLLHANQLGAGIARVRITVTRGAPTLLVTAEPYEPLGATSYADGVLVEVSRHRRQPHPLHGVKATSYQSCLWQRREASGAHVFEVLQFNTAGNVAEGSFTNVFVVEANGTLATPRPDEGCLAGVTRQAILALARERGMVVREGGIDRAYLDAAPEVFLTGSLIEVLPVRAIDGRPVGDGRAGAVAQTLRAAYAERVRGGGNLSGPRAASAASSTER